MPNNGATALVTGGASGPGLATATHLADAGAHVVLLDLPSSNGSQVAASFGGNASFAPADVTDEDGVRTAFDVAEERGPVRVVVNCAGIGTPAGSLPETARPHRSRPTGGSSRSTWWAASTSCVSAPSAWSRTIPSARSEGSSSTPRASRRSTARPP